MIKGWVRTTLIDYPGEIATIVFLGGCNMRCPMCHNAALVLRPKVFPDIPTDTILDYLERRNGKITGIVISGGEPTLSPGLFSFLRQVRAVNVKVKLDTNGYRPDVLEDLLQEQLLDYIAMDVKAPPQKYAMLAGLDKMDVARLDASIELIRNSGLGYEFRTTVINDWITEADIIEIAGWLRGSQRYVLQQFRPQDCLDPSMNGKPAYPAQVLREMQALASQQIEEVLLRGI